jgi:hypothetical protein
MNLGQKVGFPLPSSCITPFLGGANVGSHFSAGNMSFRTSEGSLSLVLPSCWPISRRMGLSIGTMIAGWDEKVSCWFWLHLKFLKAVSHMLNGSSMFLEL